VSRKLPQDIIRLLIVLIHEAHVLTMLNSTRAQAASQEVPSRRHRHCCHAPLGGLICCKREGMLSQVGAPTDCMAAWIPHGQNL
jgi:hypothetical protein